MTPEAEMTTATALVEAADAVAKIRADGRLQGFARARLHPVQQSESQKASGFQAALDEQALATRL